MKKFLLLGAALLTIQALPAIAQDAPPEAGKKGHHGEKMFEKHDANKDGILTEDEVVKGAEERAKKKFAETDADKDGKVTKEEAKTRSEQMKAKWAEKKKAREERREEAAE